MDGSVSHVIYVALCTSAMQHLVFESRGYWIGRLPHIGAFLLYLVILIGGYSVMYMLVIRKLRITSEDEITMKDVGPMFAIIISVMGLTNLSHAVDAPVKAKMLFTCADTLFFIYVFWGQVHERQKMAVQRELDTVKNLWRQSQKQYQMTQDNIDTINRKCHDMRHQIRLLLNQESTDAGKKYAAEIEQAIKIYDTSLQTGNAALDMVLREKALYCKTHGIEWTCMADGSKMNFMDPGDICSIMGNAIENALQAVAALEVPEQRVINIRIYNQNSFVIVQIQNYFAGKIRFLNGLPQTDKENEKYHGFGIKSIQYTVERYRGLMSIHAENQIFTLQLTIPIPAHP